MIYARDFAGGSEDLFLAIVLADDVENIGEAVVIVICSFDVWAEKRLRDGTRRVVLVESIDEAAERLSSPFPAVGGLSWISFPSACK